MNLDSARITVCNDGAIAADDLPRIFDRLFRGNPNRGGSGHGLGLAIARAIVAKHAGSLTVTSEDNRVCAAIDLGDPA